MNGPELHLVHCQNLSAELVSEPIYAEQHGSLPCRKELRAASGRVPSPERISRKQAMLPLLALAKCQGSDDKQVELAVRDVE